MVLNCGFGKVKILVLRVYLRSEKPKKLYFVLRRDTYVLSGEWNDCVFKVFCVSWDVGVPPSHDDVVVQRHINGVFVQPLVGFFEHVSHSELVLFKLMADF